MIQLTNPVGDKRNIDPDTIILIFYSKFLSPPKGKCNVIADGVIRSFIETPNQAAKIVSEAVKLVKFTLPDTGIPDRAKGPIWFRLNAILNVDGGPDGAIISCSGQKGTTKVVESKADVEAAIATASR